MQRNTRLRRCHRSRAQTRFIRQRSVNCPNTVSMRERTRPKTGLWYAAALGECARRKGACNTMPFVRKKAWPIGKPVVAIPQDNTRCACQQNGCDFSIGFISRSQEDTGQHSRPAQLSMHTKAIKGLPIRMIIALAGFPSKANTTCALWQTDTPELAHCL